MQFCQPFGQSENAAAMRQFQAVVKSCFVSLGDFVTFEAIYFQLCSLSVKMRLLLIASFSGLCTFSRKGKAAPRFLYSFYATLSSRKAQGLSVILSAGSKQLMGGLEKNGLQKQR